MYQLTSEQKLANYEELIAIKSSKVEKLQKEIKSLEAKAAKLRKSSGVSASGVFDSAIKSMAGR
jgi:shikimate kinase